MDRDSLLIPMSEQFISMTRDEIFVQAISYLRSKSTLWGEFCTGDGNCTQDLHKYLGNLLKMVIIVDFATIYSI